jgi:hypothetical protein
MVIGIFWSSVWLSTFSWPVLFAAIWVVIALSNPYRTPTFPGVAWYRWARGLWRDTRCGRMVAVGRPVAPVPTTQRSQHGT